MKTIKNREIKFNNCIRKAENAFLELHKEKVMNVNSSLIKEVQSPVSVERKFGELKKPETKK